MRPHLLLLRQEGRLLYLPQEVRGIEMSKPAKKKRQCECGVVSMLSRHKKWCPGLVRPIKHKSGKESIMDKTGLPECCQKAKEDLERKRDHAGRMAVHEAYSPHMFHGANYSCEVIESHIEYCYERIRRGWRYEPEVEYGRKILIAPIRARRGRA